MKKLQNAFSALVVRLRQTDYKKTSKELVFFSRFFILVTSYLLFYLLQKIANLRLISRLIQPLAARGRDVREKVFRLFNTTSEGEISSLDLIELAVSHLRAKKSRTLITVGGMSIGFGSVIFLLSLGYGVQRLVISRVARLDEMKQINVTVGQASSLALDEQTITNFKEIEGVTDVLPLISAVAKVNYNNSASDVVAYGVTKEYLHQSAILPVYGTLFEDGEVSTAVSIGHGSDETSGTQSTEFFGAKIGKKIADIRYSLYPLVWKPVYKGPSESSELLGYTNRVEGDQTAEEVWGNTYDNPTELITGQDTFGNTFAPWIENSFPLWEKADCNDKQEYDCVDGQYKIIKEGALQSSQTGYITETDVTVTRYHIIAETAPELTEGEVVQKIQFRLTKEVYAQLYSDAVNDDQLLNLFSTQDAQSGSFSGELVYGESYASEWGYAGKNNNGSKVGYWIRAQLPQWRKVDCKDCDGMFLQEVDESEQQVTAMAFIRASEAVIVGMDSPPQRTQSEATAQGATAVAKEASSSGEASGSGVLGFSQGTLQETVLEDGSVEWVMIASDSASTAGGSTRDILSFPASAKREAVVNRAMLKVLNLEESQAVGETFQTVFRLDEEFFEQPGYQAESEPVGYTIVAVVPDEKTPAFYLPFSDLKSLGVQNYSQLKVVVKNQGVLPEVRQTIESSGFKTASVVDTVGRINSLFDTIRVFLSLLGFIALGVAALGMFNTLTVSLLEKTREVGLMKVIGMKSSEVNRLFLAESIIMGLTGGIFGLVFSVIGGKLLSFAVSTISITKGIGYINLVYVPIGLAVGIILLSFMIGVLTGLYPSRRAMKISALNALRYE